MKKMTKVIFASVIAAAVAGTAAAEVSVTADFASAYVFRGVTYNDGPVFQPGIEASGFNIPETAGGFTLGAWANYDIGDYDEELNSSEFSEVDWYVSYSLPSFVDGLDLFLGYCEYTYPTSEDGGDKEGNIGASYDIAGVGIGYTAYFNVGGGAKYVYNEFTVGYEHSFTDALSASVGASAAYLMVDEEGAEDGFHDGSLSAGVSYGFYESWSVGASLAYIAQLDDEILVDAKYGDGYDVDVVGMLSLGCSF